MPNRKRVAARPKSAETLTRPGLGGLPNARKSAFRSDRVPDRAELADTGFLASSDRQRRDRRHRLAAPAGAAGFLASGTMELPLCDGRVLVAADFVEVAAVLCPGSLKPAHHRLGVLDEPDRQVRGNSAARLCVR